MRPYPLAAMTIMALVACTVPALVLAVGGEAHRSTLILPLRTLDPPPASHPATSPVDELRALLEQLNSPAPGHRTAECGGAVSWRPLISPGAPGTGWISTVAGEVCTFEAELGGVPILDAAIRLHRDRHGKRTYLVVPASLAPGQVEPAVSLPVTGRWHDLWQLSDSKVLTAAAEYMLGSADDPAPAVSRAWLPRAAQLHPVYAVTESILRIPAEQLLLLDARTGTLIERRDLRMPAVSGAGLVFDPNPVVASGDRTLSEGDDVDPWRVEVVLHDLDGTGLLQGLWAEIHTPAGRAFDQQQRFFFSSQNPHFEEVMAYHHVTEAQRYVQSLGFVHLNARPQEVEVHATSADCSWFSSVSGVIYLGDGGVDDGEDADIILHEYGHSLFDVAVGGTSSREIRALNEGFADYFAATRSGDPCVGDWDATHYATGCLRNLEDVRLYPVDLTGESHADGLIWGGLLWRLRDLIGPYGTDVLALETLYYLTPLSSMADAASALLCAAEALERAGTIADLTEQIEDILGERGFMPRHGSWSLAAGAGQRTLPLDFSFVGPGCNGIWSDSVKVAADGALLLQPASGGHGAEGSYAQFPMLAPVMALPASNGLWTHDSLDVRWEGTFWELCVDLRFRQAGQVVRHAIARFTHAGQIEVAWLGDGDTEAFPCLVGWFPAGTAGPLTWIDLPREGEITRGPGQGVASSIAVQPFELTGAIWQLAPVGAEGYRATLTRGPIPDDPRSERALLLFPSPARTSGRIAFRLHVPGSFRLDLLDPSGRRISGLPLGPMQPGLHEVAVNALTPTARSLPSGMYLLILTGGGQSRIGRLMLLR